MRVKRYIVDSMPEAMEKIRLDLGIDAVILNSKSIKTGGLFGMFGKQKIEVIAAVDEKVPERGSTLVADEHRSKDVFSSKGQAGTYTAQQAYRKANLAKEPAGKTATLPNEQRAEAASKAAPPMVAPQTEAREQPSVQQAEIPAKVPHVSLEPTGAAENKAANDALANEVRDMRQMFQKLLVNDLSQQLPPAVQEVRSRLVSQEVGEEVAAEII
ncbi:flagellar biosynthesis protein FlhF, partial [Mesorhizobium sp. M00.F.Ca.ET.186.01.1.1]